MRDEKGSVIRDQGSVGQGTRRSHLEEKILDTGCWILDVWEWVRLNKGRGRRDKRIGEVILSGVEGYL
jgi:hypothetical protein